MVDDFPLWWATVISIVLFLGIAVGCWLMPRDEVFADAPDRSAWRDLRWWATTLVAIQVIIYWIFS